MDKDVKEKWVAVLRSGKYKQGFCSLRNPSGFCCLGVLCDIVSPAGWVKVKGRFRAMEHWSWQMQSNDYEMHQLLPIRFRNLINLSEEEQQILIQMNDSGGTGFEGIADYIEAHL